MHSQKKSVWSHERQKLAKTTQFSLVMMRLSHSFPGWIKLSELDCTNIAYTLCLHTSRGTIKWQLVRSFNDKSRQTGVCRLQGQTSSISSEKISDFHPLSASIVYFNHLKPLISLPLKIIQNSSLTTTARSNEGHIYIMHHLRQMSKKWYAVGNRSS